MKPLFEKKEMDRFWVNLLVVLAGISFYFVLNHIKEVSGMMGSIGKVLTPFVYGFVLAFLLNTPMMFFDRKMSSVLKSNTLRRAIAVVITLVLVFGALFLMTLVMGPQLYDSGLTLITNVQTFVGGLDENAFDAIQQWFVNYNLPIDVYNQLEAQWMNLVDQASDILVAAVQYIIGYFGTITNGVTNVMIAVVVSVYLLMSKEYFFAQTRKSCYAMLPKKSVEQVFRVGKLISETFNGFLNGKIIDSIIMGLLIFIAMTILRMPYVALVSLICGFTNIIPFFGPFIGAIPSIFIIFIVSPIKAVEFAILIIVLQQIDGNIIGPKILGETTGLSAFWVLFAILVGGGLAGFVGMILGVPTFAVLFTLLREYMDKRLENKNLPTDTIVYETVGIDPYQATNELIKEGETNGKTTGTTESDS